MTWMVGPLLGFDLETLGTDPLTTLPCSFALVDYEWGKKQKSRYALVNPGVPIPPETTEIHGITDQMVQERGGELERQIFGLSARLLTASNEGVPVVGSNVSFDLTIIDSCFRRFCDGKSLRDEGWRGIVIDVLVIDRHVNKYRKGSRKLSALCEHYEVAADRAHHAAGDAEAAVEVALAIAEKYPEIKHMNAEELHVAQAAWRRTWLTEFNEYRVEKGQNPLPESEGNWPLLTDERVLI